MLYNSNGSLYTAGVCTLSVYSLRVTEQSPSDLIHFFSNPNFELIKMEF